MTRIKGQKKGFLTRLRENQAGNVIAIYAASLIPLLGMLGGGIDMSRIYLAKTRMQQACDAGALAGRKKMGGGAWSANSYAAKTVAENLFNVNFKSGSYGTTGLTKNFTESDGKVSGTATVQVPMAVMQLFDQGAKSITVTCQAEMKIPNTDVMFVLDVTGSMASTNPGDSDTKINGMRKAVRCFYETLARVDTVANCGTTPSGISPNAQLRFGFVPYSTNVNVGGLLKNEWMADSWNYQTRVANKYNETSSVAGATYTETTYSLNKKSKCENWASGTEVVGLADDEAPASFTATRNTYSFNSWNGGSDKCVRNVAPATVSFTKADNGTFFRNWTYKQASINVSGLKAGGSSWNNLLTLPVGTNGTDTTVAWDGCIEERATQSYSSYYPLRTDTKDLDINMVPIAGDDSTKWGPALPDAIWGRYNWWSWTTDPVITASDLSRNRSYACPVAARRLQIYSTSGDFDTYVGSLSPTGNTYHDIGMVWGARLLSPTGLFADDNDFTPSGGEIQRHLIFMTDGDACTGTDNYQAYGLNWWDRRTTGSAPSDGCTSTGTLTQQVNARTEALCTMVKNMNISLWVISYGTGVSGSVKTRLENCASPGKYFEATNTATLLAQFQQIADKISQLRLVE